MILFVVMVVQVLVIMCFFIYRKEDKKKTDNESKTEDDDKTEDESKTNFESQKAIKFVNYRLAKKVLSKTNTKLSILDKSKSIWNVQIRPVEFKEDLHLLLVRKANFLLLKIPKNTFKEPRLLFKYLKNKGLLDLEISNESGYYNLRDINPDGCGYDFSSHLQNVFEYECD